VRSKMNQRAGARRQKVGGGMRAVAYALLWLCIVLPLWVITLVVEAHYDYIPPMWLALWAFWVPTVLIVVREVYLMRK